MAAPGPVLTLTDLFYMGTGTATSQDSGETVPHRLALLPWKQQSEDAWLNVMFPQSWAATGTASDPRLCLGLVGLWVVTP